MPLNRDRKILGRMDIQINIQQASTTSTTTGGARTTYTQRGPYHASREFLARKQMETEVATRITSFQQVKFVVRYDTTVLSYLTKASLIEVVDETDKQYNIISVTTDTGRNQFIEIIAELKQ
jgi:head-tail adaptor